LKTFEFDFTSKNLDKIEKILITLIKNNWNFNNFGSLFNRVYLELIGHIKTSLFELFYNRNHLSNDIADSDDYNQREIK
jgi:hypothetical protein